MSANDLPLDRLPETLSAQDALALLAQLAEHGADDSGQTPAIATPGGGQGALSDALTRLIADVLKLAPDEIPLSRPLIELGLDSISATDAIGRFNEEHGLSVPGTILFEFANITELSAHLWDLHRDVLQARYGDSAPPGPGEPASADGSSCSSAEPAPRISIEPVGSRDESMPVARPSDATDFEKPARRIDVMTMWTQIEESLTEAPQVVAQESVRPPVGAWQKCVEAATGLWPGTRCIALPEMHASIALLRAACGPAAGRVLWIGSDAPEGVEALDPSGDDTLERLLECEDRSLMVCTPAREAFERMPVHLWRAIERMRTRSGCQLALFAPVIDTWLAGELKRTEHEVLLLGDAPLMAALLAKDAVARFDPVVLEAFSNAYRNEYAASGLHAPLAQFRAGRNE